MSKITQLQNDECDPSSLAPESVLLVMTLCNLLESILYLPNAGVINNLFSLSEGIESVGGESAWAKPRIYLSRQAEEQKLGQGSQGRRVWVQDL